MDWGSIGLSTLVKKAVIIIDAGSGVIDDSNVVDIDSAGGAENAQPEGKAAAAEAAMVDRQAAGAGGAIHGNSAAATVGRSGIGAIDPDIADDNTVGITDSDDISIPLGGVDIHSDSKTFKMRADGSVHINDAGITVHLPLAGTAGDNRITGTGADEMNKIFSIKINFPERAVGFGFICTRGGKDKGGGAGGALRDSTQGMIKGFPGGSFRQAVSGVVTGRRDIKISHGGKGEEKDDREKNED